VTVGEPAVEEACEPVVAAVEAGGPVVEEAGEPAAAAVEVGGLPVAEAGEPPGEAMVAATAVASCNRAPLPSLAQPPAGDFHKSKFLLPAERNASENVQQYSSRPANVEIRHRSISNTITDSRAESPKHCARSSLLRMQSGALEADPMSPAVPAGVQKAPDSCLGTAASRAQLPETWRQMQALAKTLKSR